MIQLKDITIETRHSILTKTDYLFEDSCVYGIVAENGSGKTTLFRTMMNLLQPKSGKILFEDKSIEQMLGCIFYFESVEWLDENLNGLDYLRFVKSLWKSNVQISDIINLWNMEEYIKIPISKYSLGMKQRLVIAMYFVSDAKYMIMDEITNGLDEENRKHFFKLISDLKSKGKTILLSSHYKDEIIEVCDKVLQIKQNQLCEVSS
ncbi:ATP-binding cassette domain-containing protein [[Clostridium] innocuum]|uniref:ATP-binding cassette domain-containing protein n=1 Tax=Clostridium innocuum TaxID=1522 RepID=UPI0032584B93